MPLKTDTSNHLNTGKKAEDEALTYLLGKKLKLLRKNYRSYFGEIDLIMKDNDYVTFVEVRHRNKCAYGSALESVDRHKIKKIIKTATIYLQQRNWLYTVPCRFDIIAIHPVAGRTQLEWIKNAFTLDY